MGSRFLSLQVETYLELPLRDQRLVAKAMLEDGWIGPDFAPTAAAAGGGGVPQPAGGAPAAAGETARDSGGGGGGALARELPSVAATAAELWRRVDAMSRCH